MILTSRKQHVLKDWNTFSCSGMFQSLGCILIGWIFFWNLGFAQTNSSLPLAVIGAGPAGLAAMSELKAQGVSWVGYERSPGVGGVWNSENDSSPAYASLRTNSSKSSTHLGMAWIGVKGPYLRRQQALDYLERFAHERDLIGQIRFNMELITISKSDHGTWLVELKDRISGKKETQEMRGVIFATGFYNKENKIIPEGLWKQAKDAGIEVLHASDYRSPERYKNKRVVVVGSGNSGSEIVTEVSRVATKTYFSVRTTPWIVPLKILGKPADEIAQGPSLPHTLELALFHLLQRLTVGHPTSLGFKAPKHGLLDKIPISDHGIVKAIRKGYISLRSGIEAIESGKVLFTGQKNADQIDTIIFATGYRTRIPLPVKYGDLEDSSFPLPYLIFHPTERGLAFMTDVSVLQGLWPISLEQAKALALYFRSESRSLPNVEAFDEKKLRPFPSFKGSILGKSDRFHVDAKIYVKALRAFRKWIRSN